jgi:hypothetical protein
MKAKEWGVRALVSVGVALLGACSALPGFGTQPTAAPSPAASPAAAVTTPMPPSCPAPIGGEQVFEQPTLGICFLYPADFYVYASTAVILHGPLHGSGEAGAGAMTITTDSLAGQTLQEYADQAAVPVSSGDHPTQQAIVFGNGYSGILIDNSGAPSGWREVLLEHGGKVFQISFQPWSDDQPAAKADLERIYTSISASWVFRK